MGPKPAQNRPQTTPTGPRKIQNCSHIHRLPKEPESEWQQEESEWQQEDYNNFAGQDGLPEIDIAAELQRVAFEGLAVIGQAIWQAECLRRPLLNIVILFMRVQDHQHAPWDYLEPQAATALGEVDELLRQQTALGATPLPSAAVKQLKVLQRHAQDVAVLANCRWIDQKTLAAKGMPIELLSRLEASFGVTALHDDALYSRLGNSKYHTFANNKRYGERKHRHGRGGRRAPPAPPAPPGSAAEASSSADLIEPLRINLLELVPEDRTVYTELSDIGHASQTGAQTSTKARNMNELTYGELFGEPAKRSPASSSVASSSAAPPGVPPWAWSTLHMKIEVVLKKHQVEYSIALIDDIVMTLR